MKKGWATVRISDVCRLMTGGTPSRQKPEYFGGAVRWLVSGDIHKGEIFDCDGRITEAALRESNAKLLPINSVMIALNGQGKTRGTVAILRTRATCNQSLVSIYPNEPDKLLPEFLYANLHGRYQEIRQMTGDSGNDRRGLNMGLIASIKIPIAPIPEQRRIVGILDKAFEGIATAKTNAERNRRSARSIFDSYLQSIFIQGSGRWVKRKLGAIAKVESGGTPSVSKREYWGGEIPWYSSGELNDTYTTDPERTISEAGLNNSNAKVFPKGSLLIGMYDTAALKMSILDRDSAFNQAISGVKPNDDIELEFVLHAINAYKPRLLLERRGVRQKNLSLGKIKDIAIPLPERSEQRAVLSRLCVVTDEVRRLEDIYRLKFAKLGELKRSLLHQAFSGEL